MKWLILFPLWVFLLSYVIHRVREANRGDVEPGRPAAVAPSVPDEAEVPPAEPEPGSPLELRIDGKAISAMADSLEAAAGLIPVDQNYDQLSQLWPTDGLGEQAGNLANRSEFQSWELHQGEGMSFYFPQGVGLSVEEVSSSKTFARLGEIFFQDIGGAARWYRVAGPEGMTWAAFAVDAVNEFDKRERFPSGEVFHKILPADGGVARISLAPDGKLGRVQWIGEGIRVTLLDWQHCASHRAAYAALASSVRLGAGGETGGRDGLMLRMASEAGLESRLGLLEKGMDRQRVEALLGSPSGIEGATYLYDAPRRDGGHRYRVTFQNGQFLGLSSDWRALRKDPPIPGTVEWMLEKTEIRAGNAGGVGYDLGPLTDEEVTTIYSQIARLLPGSNAVEWSDLCQVLANLSELRLSDTGTLELVRGRFLEPGLPAGAAIVVLRSGDQTAAKEIFAQKAKAMMAGNAPAADDLQLMFSYIGKRHSSAGDLVKGAAQHQMGDVRSVAYSFADWFEEGVRLPLLMRGLRDAEVGVRQRSAEALAAAGGAADLIPALQKALESEIDGEVRAHLERAIERIRG
jgi:hypothetical protein